MKAPVGAFNKEKKVKGAFSEYCTTLFLMMSKLSHTRYRPSRPVPNINAESGGDSQSAIKMTLIQHKWFIFTTSNICFAVYNQQTSMQRNDAKLNVN